MQELEERRRVRELVEALPVAPLPARAADALERDGDVFLAHRWHVEQVTCVWTSYSAASLRPSSSWFDGGCHAVL